MPITIITGAIGSGKTRHCIDCIAQIHKTHPQRRCIMLVPPHYSHITEQLLINEFGGTGLNNIECTSLEKLARELLPTSDMKLGASGKNALICRAIAQTLDMADIDRFDRKILRAIGKQGFADVCASLISELHRYNVSHNMLKEQAKTTENPLLSQKLELLSIITSRYEALLDNTQYIDSDDDLSRLAQIIDKHFTPDDHIWIDKFDELLPQQLDVILALAKSGAQITITFHVCRDRENTYHGTLKAISDISSTTPTETIHLNGEMEHVKSPDLKFLFTNWHNRAVYTEKCNSIELSVSRDAYTETEQVAAKILDLVREDGYRFCDIGILCGNEESYSHIIEAVFDEYEIPYYTDTTVSISEYPIAMQILSLFDIVKHNWNYESMFTYLRAGFVYTRSGVYNGKPYYKRLDPNAIDLIENHVLRYGIEYKSMWQKSWTDKNRSMIDTALDADEKPSDVLSELDILRDAITAPLLAYCEAAKTAKTVSDYCRALYTFLEDINLYNGIHCELSKDTEKAATADSQRLAQIWNLMLDVINEVNTALGNEQVTHDEFALYITAAMSQCKIRTVPSGIDRVFIGSENMNRAVPTPVIFVMGAVSGTFPTTSNREGFLSNSDRTTLLENNLRLAPTTVKKAEKQTNAIYKLFSAATDRLYISYPSMTADGASTLPSQTVTDIVGKFCDMRVSDRTIDSDILYISSPKATLHKYLISDKSHPLWEHINSWFSENDEWNKRVITVFASRKRYLGREISLTPDISKMLYDGKNRYSATRLNTYASCPFAHFMQYGLSAREREEYEIKATDTGTYAHEIIRRFCKRIDDSQELSWRTVSDNDCEAIVSEIVSDTVDKINNSDLRDKELSADILSRMGKTVTEAAKTAKRSIQCGAFETEGYEKEVSVKLADNIELGGIIDRLDVCRHDGINEYRIIDYKTGNKEFSVSDIYHGLDMQPVIYALAMQMLDKDATISGMYYSLVHNDFAQVDITSTDKKIMSELRSNTAYNGVTFVGTDSPKTASPDEINRIESELSRSDGSLFFTGRADDLGFTKSVRTRPESVYLMDKVRSNIIEADRDIRGGNIEISPLASGTKNACTFCAYRSVCKFDENQKAERAITLKDSEIWTKLKEEN